MSTDAHDDPGGVSPADPVGHGIVCRPQTGLVSERPRYDAGVVLITFHHALKASLEGEWTCSRHRTVDVIVPSPPKALRGGAGAG